MKTRKLITDIVNWFEDVDKDGSNDYDDSTIEGSAYNLLVRAVRILRENDKADTELKRHAKGIKEAVDKTITI